MARVLVAYDGSGHSDWTLADLRRAGMPQKAEALVLTVADSWIDRVGLMGYPTGPYSLADSFSDAMTLSLEEAERTAQRGVRILQGYFPNWDIHPTSVSDSAAQGILSTIRGWKPDLVVLGSHGRAAAGRLLFGSVSQKVLAHAHCNLRISKGRQAIEIEIPPLRVLVAMDGSQESEMAFEMALSRHWPQGTVLKLITVEDVEVSLAYLHPSGPVRYWTHGEDADPVAWVDRMLSYQKERIQERGWIAAATAMRGDPNREILKEAKNWGADIIFVGPRGLAGREKVIAGSVSMTLATHAECSVEIVHRLWGATVCCDSVREQHRECLMREAKRSEMRP